MVDPNIYALNIMLQLDATAAFSTLDDFSEHVVEVENTIVEVGQKAIGQIEVSIGTLDEGITKITAKLRDINTEGGNLNTAFQKSLITTGDIEENYDDQIKQIKKQIDLTQEVYDLTDEIVKFGEEELKRINEHNKEMDQLIDAITLKNKGHEQELGLVEDELDTADSLFDRMVNMGKQTRTNTQYHRSLSDVLRQILGLLMDIDKETENFVTTNYRYYGSQQAILGQVRLLAIEQGLFYGTALETYKLLADWRIPKEEILKYTKAISMANRFTGVGVQTLVDYTARMRQVGLTAPLVERNLVFMSDAMRKLGLSTEDITRSLQSTTMSARQLETVFKGENQAAKFEQLKLVLGGLSKQMGFTAEDATKLMDHLLDPMNRAKFEAFSGQTINSVEDMQKAIVKAGRNIAPMIEDVTKKVEAGLMDSKAGQMMLQTYADTYFGGSEAAMHMAASLDKMAKKMGLNLEKAEDLEKAMAAVRKEIEDPFAEANNTLTAQWRILTERGGNLIKMALQPLADKLRDLIKIINVWVDNIAENIRIVQKWWNVFKTNFPIFSKFLGYLASGVIAVGLFTAAIVALGIVLGGIPLLLWGFSAGIIGVFRAIGQGLATMARAITSVMVELLVLGTTFVLVGIGAYYFAMGVSEVAKHGWLAIPAVLGMIAAFGLLGLVLIGLASLIQGPIAAGLIILSGALLAIGVTAALIGYSLMLGAQAFDQFVDTLQKLVDMDVVSVGMKLNILGALVMTASVLLLAGAVALVPASLLLMAGVGILWVASTIFANASQMLVTGAAYLQVGADIILEASIVLLAGSLTLATASAVLLGSMSALMTATALLLPTSMGLLVAAGVMMAGSYLLNIGSGLFAAASQLIAQYSPVLYQGALVLVGAAVIVGIAGANLLTSAIALGFGAAAMLVSAGVMSTAAMAIAFAGSIFAMGAAAIMGGTTVLVAAGLLMITASAYIRQSSIILAETTGILAQSVTSLAQTVSMAGVLMVAATALAAAGAILIPAVLVLRTGMNWLVDMTTKFATIAPHVETIGRGLLNLVQAFAMLRSAQPSQLHQLADDGLAAIPKLERFAGQLLTVSGQIGIAARTFQQPASDLSMAVGMMNAALNDFEVRNLEFGSKLGDIGLQIEAYATLLESASERIETAVTTKALPALSDAERTGLNNIVQSEAITTVQVLDKREGDVASRSEDMAAMQSEYLRRLVEALIPALANSDSRLTTMQSLMEQYMPMMVTEDRGSMSSEMNQWMR